MDWKTLDANSNYLAATSVGNYALFGGGKQVGSGYSAAVDVYAVI